MFNKYFVREQNSNKYSNGHCLIIGGSKDYSGAIYLAAKAAYKTDCGIVTIAFPSELENIYRIKCNEELLLSLPSVKGYISSKSVSILNDYIKEKRVSSMVIGPGISKNEIVYRFFEEFLSNFNPLQNEKNNKVPPKIKKSKLVLSEKTEEKNTTAENIIPVLIDADGIFHLKQYLVKNKNIMNIIITPHAGELSKFLEIKTPVITDERSKFAKIAAKRINGICVLKGYNTIIADEENINFDTMGSPVLATAGSGDVLSGIIGGILARYSRNNKIEKADLFDICKNGVLIHSSCGNLAEKEKKHGIIASDLIEKIGYAIYLIEKEI